MTFVILYHDGDRHYLEGCLKSLPYDAKAVVCYTRKVDYSPNGESMWVHSQQTQNNFLMATINYVGEFSFSKARNLAKSLTEDEWIFSLDADERLSASQHDELRELQADLLNFPPEAMGVWIYNYNFFKHQSRDGEQHVDLVKQCRIFRNSLEWRYDCHELIEEPIKDLKGEIYYSAIIVIHEGYKCSLGDFAKKLKRNIELYAKHIDKPYYFQVLLNEASTLKRLLEERIN